jgi:predicted nucleic acid-binding protein
VARIKLLIDTDIFIDYLKGMSPAKAVFRSKDIDIYCSVLTKKELLNKPGLKNSERKKIVNIFRKLKTILIDSDISIKYSDLLAKYHERGLQPPDAIIAATAWSKKLPLLTRNRKHFTYIEEITLSPIYDQS